jgi:hypothetical protein
MLRSAWSFGLHINIIIVLRYLTRIHYDGRFKSKSSIGLKDIVVDNGIV